MDKAELRRAERGTRILDQRDSTRRRRLMHPLCRVVIRPTALLGFPGRNVAVNVEELNESILCARVTRRLTTRSDVRVRLQLGPFDQAFDLRGSVRGCAEEAGAWIVWIDLREIPGDFKVCVRGLIRQAG